VDFLFECDRPLQIVGSQTSLQQFFPTTPTAPGGVADNRAPPPDSVPRTQERFQASINARLTEKLLKATVKIIAHGPYVISMLQNPAMEEFLVELDVVPEGFRFPSRRPVTRRLDEFLDEEGSSQDAHVRDILPYFSGG